jgi:hypothetical protein
VLWDMSDEAESVVENDKDIFSYILVECIYISREKMNVLPSPRLFHAIIHFDTSSFLEKEKPLTTGICSIASTT